MSVYPTPSWWVKPAQRAAGKLLKTFTTEKHTGSGIEPGFPNCEAHAFPRRHCTPLGLGISGEEWITTCSTVLCNGRRYSCGMSVILSIDNYERPVFAIISELY